MLIGQLEGILGCSVWCVERSVLGGSVAISLEAPSRRSHLGVLTFVVSFPVI